MFGEKSNKYIRGYKQIIINLWGEMLKKNYWISAVAQETVCGFCISASNEEINEKS
jgi:hypothetical protein